MKADLVKIWYYMYYTYCFDNFHICGKYNKLKNALLILQKNLH